LKPNIQHEALHALHTDSFIWLDCKILPSSRHSRIWNCLQWNKTHSVAGSARSTGRTYSARSPRSSSWILLEDCARKV